MVSLLSLAEREREKVVNTGIKKVERVVAGGRNEGDQIEMNWKLSLNGKSKG